MNEIKEISLCEFFELQNNDGFSYVDLISINPNESYILCVVLYNYGMEVYFDDKENKLMVKQYND